MPAAILAIIQGIMAVVEAAPQIAGIVSSAKNMFSALFQSKLITIELQNSLHAWVDARAALAKQGIVPVAWTVEPDPAPTPAAPPVVVPPPA